MNSPPDDPNRAAPTGFRLRPAVQADAAAIAALTAELDYVTTPEAIVERLVLFAGRADQLVTVAQTKDGQLCAWVHAWHSVTLESGPRVEIMGLVISSKHRRGGVGRALVRHVEDWASKLGIAGVVVRSNEKRLESHPFYLALGYEHTKTQRVYRKKLKR